MQKHRSCRRICAGNERDSFSLSKREFDRETVRGRCRLGSTSLGGMAAPPLFSRRARDAKRNASEGEAGRTKKEETEADVPDGRDGFEHLGLRPWLVATCKALSMRRPTVVQRACVPMALRGRDVCGCAQTGSGKTAAFALPILHGLAEERYGVYALVLEPTRELAFQVADQFLALGAGMSLRVAVVVGGMGPAMQAKELLRRPHVVVATPGRLRDQLETQREVGQCFQNLNVLVLDEADRLLDRTFENDLEVITHHLPQGRQTMLYSATITEEVEGILEKNTRNVFRFSAYQGLRTPDSLDQKYIFVPKRVKEVYLHYLLKNLEELEVRSAIVFVARCTTCVKLEALLKELEIPAVSLHSRNPQRKRLASLDKFKGGVVNLLLATDVASRGLDIPEVDLVICFDPPAVPEDYIHRVGRTARAGRGGKAISFVTQYDVDSFKHVESLLGIRMEEHECKEDEVLEDLMLVLNARRHANMNIYDREMLEKERVVKKRRLRPVIAD